MPFGSDSTSEFVRLARGAGEVSLERVAFEIASDAMPDLNPSPYVARLDRLAERVRERCPRPGDSLRTLGQIRWVLHVEEEFRGDAEDYYNPANSYFPEVLDRRLGIPITLSLLYLSLGLRLGLPLAGVSLPARFMLRVLDQPRPMFVDAFGDGAVLDREGCERRLSEVVGTRVNLAPEQIAPCAPKEWAGRMLRNLREIHLREANFEAALPVVRRLAALDSTSWEVRRDWGIVALHAGYPGEAIAPLEGCLADANRRDEAAEIESLVRVARKRLAERN